MSKRALKLLRLSLIASKKNCWACIWKWILLLDKMKFRYVANTIFYNISSENITYAIMKHFLNCLFWFIFYQYFGFIINVVKISSASCYLVSATLKLCLTNDYLPNFLFYNILPNPKSFSKPVIGSDVSCHSA